MVVITILEEATTNTEAEEEEVLQRTVETMDKTGHETSDSMTRENIITKEVVIVAASMIEDITAVIEAEVMTTDAEDSDKAPVHRTNLDKTLARTISSTNNVVDLTEEEGMVETEAVDMEETVVTTDNLLVVASSLTESQIDTGAEAVVNEGKIKFPISDIRLTNCVNSIDSTVYMCSSPSPCFC